MVCIRLAFFARCCYWCCCFVYVVGNSKSQIQTFCQHMQEARERDRFCVCQTEFQAVYMQIRISDKEQRHQTQTTPTIQPKINAAKFTAICCVCVCRETANISAVSMECRLRSRRSFSRSFSIVVLASFFAFFLILLLSSLPFFSVCSIEFFRFYCHTSDIVTQPKRLHLLIRQMKSKCRKSSRFSAIIVEAESFAQRTKIAHDSSVQSFQTKETIEANLFYWNWIVLRLICMRKQCENLIMLDFFELFGARCEYEAKWKSKCGKYLLHTHTRSSECQ